MQLTDNDNGGSYQLRSPVDHEQQRLHRAALGQGIPWRAQSSGLPSLHLWSCQSGEAPGRMGLSFSIL